MTDEDENPGPVDQMLDLFVYAPLGLVLDARSLLPRFIDRGRGQVALAKTLGRYAIERGNTAAETALSGVFGRFSGDGQLQGDPRSGATTVAGEPHESHTTASRPDPATPTVPMERDESVADGVDIDPATLAIPDYDSLSASQVVPRLASLSTDELIAVRDYERANRGRMTILNRVAQLQAS